MASIGFDVHTVRMILENIESVKEENISEGDYLKICNALKYLHQCIEPRELPPPPTTPRSVLEPMTIPIDVEPYIIDWLVEGPILARNRLQSELTWIRNYGIRLNVEDKIKVCERVLDSNIITRPPRDDCTSHLYIRHCRDLILSETDTTIDQLTHEYYRQKHRRRMTEIVRLEREIAEIDNVAATAPR